MNNFRYREHHVVQHRGGLGHGHRHHHLHGPRVPGYHEQCHPNHQGRPDWHRVEQHHQTAVRSHYGLVGFDGGKFVTYFRFLFSFVLNDVNQCPKHLEITYLHIFCQIWLLCGWIYTTIVLRAFVSELWLVLIWLCFEFYPTTLEINNFTDLKAFTIFFSTH